MNDTIFIELRNLQKCGFYQPPRKHENRVKNESILWFLERTLASCLILQNTLENQHFSERNFHSTDAENSISRQKHKTSRSRHFDYYTKIKRIFRFARTLDSEANSTNPRASVFCVSFILMNNRTGKTFNTIRNHIYVTLIYVEKSVILQINHFIMEIY